MVNKDEKSHFPLAIWLPIPLSRFRTMEEKRKVHVKERLDSAARSVTGGREGGTPAKKKRKPKKLFLSLFLIIA
jgi:hypothetical protein